MSIDRLRPLDRLMLGASRTWPQDIGALLVLDGARLVDGDGGLRIDVLQQRIASRLHLVPRFRQAILEPGRFRGGPLWIDDSDFDIAEHFRVHPVPAPGGEGEVLEAVQELRRHPLDPASRLWEMWFLTGLSGGQIGLYVRIHHALADGMAAMTTVTAFLDSPNNSSPGLTAPWAPARPPSERALVVDALLRRTRSWASLFRPLLHPIAATRRMAAALPAMYELIAESPATRTSLDRVAGADRRVALVRDRLDDVKAAGSPHGATVNDVLLAAVAGGLRALLEERGELSEGTTLRAYSPISLRKGLPGVQEGNLVVQMAIPLPLGKPDPLARLRVIAAETKQRKGRARTSLEFLIRGRIMRRLMLMAAMRQRVNIATASIPGPTEPLYLLGAPVLEVFPILPLMANQPLAVGALSYAGALTIGVTADGDAIPDLDVFADGLCAELAALGALPVTGEESVPERVR